MCEIELLIDFIGRKLPGESCQQIALLGQLFLKRWKQLFSRCESCFLREDVRLRHLTETELTREDIKQVTLDRDDPLGRSDLSTERRFLNGSGHDIARQRTIS